MKKSLKISLISLLSILVLGACSPSTPTSSSTSEDSSGSTTSEEVVTWTDTEAKLMKDHLHNEVLPYIDLASHQVEYEDGYITISGSEVTHNDLESYALLYKNWKDISSSYSSDKVFAFEKEVDTIEGKRYIEVLFYAFNEGIVLDGNFYLEAHDPYVYTYPSDKALEYASTFMSNELPPIFEAGHYKYNNSAQSIFGYNIGGTTDDNGYKELLTKAGWTVNETKDDQGYYTALSKDSRYQIAFIYDLVKDRFELYFEPGPVFPSDAIKDIFAKYPLLTAFTIPSYSKEGITFEVLEAQNNELYYENKLYDGMYYIVGFFGATSTEYNEYLDILRNNKWTVTDISTDKKTVSSATLFDDKLGTMKMEVGISFDYVILQVFMKIEPIPAGWPSDEINTYLTSLGIKDTIPVYTLGDVTFSWLDDYFGNAILFNTKENEEAKVAEAYGKILVGANFKAGEPNQFGDIEYTSPNEEFILNVQVALTPGTVTVSIIPLVEE